MPQAVPDNNYIVKTGDTLWSIAQQAYGDGAYWLQIYDANKSIIGNDPNTLQTGTILSIPQLQAHTTNYTVKSGDTLWSIAQHFYANGDAWQKIYDANKAVIGADPNTLHAGMILHIP